MATTLHPRTPHGGRGRRLRSVAALGLALATVLGASAALTPARAAVTHSARGGGFSLLPFGCANPANHLSLDKLLPANWGKISTGARCFGQVRVPAGQKGPSATSGPQGLGPAQIQDAYALPQLSSSGSAATVAIVDAYDNPKAKADLDVYRSTFGLPAMATCASPAAGTVARPCFTKLNQDGKAGPLPSADAGWGLEISLDLDAVSAACPRCSIVLVEADSAGTDDLMAAVATAISLQPAAISLSWGGSEDSTITASDATLRSAQSVPVAITASTGDNGYGVSWPASSPYVTAVGGTSLTRSGGTWTESAWSGAGSGCSASEAQPAWQHALAAITGACGNRAIADVAAVADPDTGLAVYDSYNSCPFTGLFSFFCSILSILGLSQGANGWIQVGGTSLASPLVASMYAIGHNLSAVATKATPPNEWPYDNASELSDVTSGSNGSCASAPALCTAGTGWDGPTGLGTALGKGPAAFTPTGSLGGGDQNPSSDSGPHIG